MKYIPKEITEEVNITKTNPLINLAYLLVTVFGISFITFAGLGILASRLALNMTTETEQKIGNQLSLMWSKDLNIKPNDRRLPYLTELTTKLYTQIVASEDQLPLTIYVLDEVQINAMVLPGGHIFVTTGLLDAVESENELAFVLAHELAHLEARDPVQGLGRSLVFLLASTTFSLGSNNQSGSSLVLFTGQLTNLKYSRTQEENADYQAMSTIVKYYGHGQDSLRVFDRLVSQNLDDRFSTYFSTHPHTHDRINNLKKLASRNNWLMNGDKTLLPREFRSK